MDVTKAKIIPERTGPNQLTREYPKLSGFLQGLMGRAPDEVGSGSVLDEEAQSSRKLQALGAKYGFPIGTVLGMLPFGGGIAKAPSVATGSRAAQRGIIKAPGGNWLSGSVENAVKGLKRGKYGFSEPYTNEGLAELEALIKADPGREGSKLASIGATELQDMREKMAVNNWIDSQLVKKYIKNDMATERDPLRLMADAWPEKKAAKLADVQARIDALTEKTRQLARERGQPEHTLVEMRQLMIPLEKEKALIEATEGLHAPFANAFISENLGLRRMGAGFPVHGIGKSDTAKGWEASADSVIHNLPAGVRLDPEATSIGSVRKFSAENPWLSKIPPETMTYGANSYGLPEDLGFNHLIDELRNSLNPESGLPKELLLKYQDLPKVTVPQAAERVAQINAWRAAQKREADLLRANNAATVLHKEYPEKGLKWVEMKKPSDEVPDSVLADALKYEGDQMAHCVGGYCPPVLRGESRIFSLRDAKGKPHTTIEVAPGEYARADLSEDQFELVRDLAKKRGVVPDQRILREALPELPDPPSRIKQIKGHRNQKPDDEYLPYVQDFVRSGKWSDVGDLENSGLLRASNQVYQHPRDAGEGWMPRFGDLGIDEGYYTNDELVGHIQAARKKAGYASGGLVNVGYNPSLVNARAAQLEAELFN